MISGFIQNGYIKDAINLFPQMQAAKFEPRAEILTSILDAYTHLGALQLGDAIHGFFIRNLFYRSMEETTYMETSILNMYIRCGDQRKLVLILSSQMPTVLIGPSVQPLVKFVFLLDPFLVLSLFGLKGYVIQFLSSS